MSKNIGSFHIELKNNDNDRNIVALINALSHHSNTNCSIFCGTYDLAANFIKNYTVLPVYEAKYFYGQLFVWDLKSLDLATTMPGPNRILYYQNEQLPWVNHNKNIQVSLWNRMFNSERVQIFTDKPETKEIIDLTWNNRTILLPSINPENVYGIL